MLCSCVLHAQLILEQHKKQKREKERNKKRTKFCFFLLPPKKRKKCGHRKCRPKGTQVTKGRRTKDGQISHLSLSLSFVSRMHLFTVLLPGRKEDTESPVRRRRGESSLLRVSLSICALEMVSLFHQSARARRRKRASARGRKTNKQTNKGRRNKKSQKSANVAFFSEQSAADF